MNTRLAYRLDRMVSWDAALCVRCNRMSRLTGVRDFFRVVSRLGDGVFWYGTMLGMLLVERSAAVMPVLHMVVTGLLCTVLYKWLKRRTLRPRPYEVHPDIVASGKALDQFSFPSGHTLHAFAFSIIALYYYPALAGLMLPFTALVAASRPILGLHYPTDVLAGAAIGTTVAYLSLLLA